MIAICVLIGAPPVMAAWPAIDEIGSADLWIAAALALHRLGLHGRQP